MALRWERNIQVVDVTELVELVLLELCALPLVTGFGLALAIRVWSTLGAAITGRYR